MKASELITLLQDAIDKYGDLPVKRFSEDYPSELVEEVAVCGFVAPEEEYIGQRYLLIV